MMQDHACCHIILRTMIAAYHLISREGQYLSISHQHVRLECHCLCLKPLSEGLNVIFNVPKVQVSSGMQM